MTSAVANTGAAAMQAAFADAARAAQKMTGAQAGQGSAGRDPVLEGAVALMQAENAAAAAAAITRTADQMTGVLLNITA